MCVQDSVCSDVSTVCSVINSNRTILTFCSYREPD